MGPYPRAGLGHPRPCSHADGRPDEGSVGGAVPDPQETDRVGHGDGGHVHRRVSRTRSATHALVTGASRNIGKAIASALIDAGATVVCACQSDIDGAKAVADSDPRGNSVALVLDVTSRESIAAAKDQIKGQFGNIDIGKKENRYL